MLNGLKGMFDPNKNKNDDRKAFRRMIIIIIAIVVLAVAHFIYSYVSGSTEERESIIEFLRSNFHINVIDLVLCVTALIIYLILKSKNKKE